MLPDNVHLEVLENPEQLAARAAKWIAERVAATADVFRMALSGGETPRRLYRQLASEKYRSTIEWRRVELFWGDERFVPHDDTRSNYRMARETLLAHAAVLIEHIHPVITEGSPDASALRYEALLKTVYGADILSPDQPLFDVVLLGLGEDGHTASLFPGGPALRERYRWVAAVPEGPREEPRITLTYPAIASSRAVAFLVSGSNKAEAVRGVFAHDPSLPAAHVQSEGEIVWFLDEAAARALSPEAKA